MSLSDDPKNRLAFTKQWWNVWRDIDPIQSALVRARAVHLKDVIGAALKINNRLGRPPRSLAELADLLQRDAVNLWRWREGKTEASVSDMLSLASRLRLKVGDLFEDEKDSLASATLTLCTPRSSTRQSGPMVQARDAIVYSEYMIGPDGVRAGPFDERVLTEVVKRRDWPNFTAQDAVDSVGKVAESLEPILKLIAGKAC